MVAHAWPLESLLINQRKAFNRYTTAKHTIELYVQGYFDDDNVWIKSDLEPPKPIRCTPIPFGDRDSGTNGQQLKATDIGERQPAFMRIHSRTPMPMKSVLTIYGIRYKVIQIGDYTDAGFYAVVAAKELEK